MQQKDFRKPVPQPNILLFASPSVTPSNNFKSLNATKDMNMQIMGRKIDSPKLRVLKEQEKHTSQITFAQPSMQFQRDDINAIFAPIQELNHTNKEIHKKQFDFNIKQQNKANVTIQYDEQKHNNQSQNRQQRSKSANRSQKRRQQSQSAPRQNPQLLNYQHQPTGSVSNTQPIINLHIQNTKMASQAKPSSIFSYNRKKTPSMNQVDQQKYQSTGQQSVPLKNRSKSKNRQKSLNKSTVISQKFKDQLHAKPHDNKENQSINYNEFSPNKVLKKGNNFIDSDSSLSSPNVKRGNDQFIQKQLEKQYFVDNSILLKHLSPERQHQNNNNISKMHPQNLQAQLLSNRDQQQQKNMRLSAENTHLLSNNSTLVPQIQNATIVQDTSGPKFKLKRPATGTQTYIKKQHIKGIDKIVKESLKKNRTKEEVEISRKHIEDFKQRLKKQELTQRNQQVRKINAQKIVTGYSHQHKNSQINTKINNVQHQKQQIMQYKKHRSKSCMNKTDSIFGGVRPRSKERLMQYQHFNDNTVFGDQTQIENGQVKKEKKREKSLVLELKELTKQIGCEIRREIQKGKLEVQPISTTANKQRTNLSTINVKKDIKTKVNNYFSNVDKKNSDSQNDISQNNKKSKHKSKDIYKNFSQNIKKFIETKKNAKNQIKSLEQTLETQNQLKRIENLNNLTNIRSHIRHQSQNLQYIKPNQNLNLQQDNFVHNNNKVTVLKKLKPQFSKEKKQQRQNFNYNIFDQELQPRLSQSPDHSAILSINQGDISAEQQDEYYKILNSQKKYRKEKSQSASPQRKRSTSNKKRKTKKLSNKKKGLRDELDETAKSRLNQRLQFAHESIEQKDQHVLQGRPATIIPPQSDITTLENKQYYFDKSSQNRLDQSADLSRKIYDMRKSQDSYQQSNKSPNFKEQNAKVRVLMERYGYNLPQAQLQKPTADTKLLIKLHSAAITIQQNFRRHLECQGFYNLGSPNSQMYVDSEEDTNNYQYDMTSEKKDQRYIPQQLIAQTSPLRIKTHHLNHNQQQQQFRPREEVKQNKFYSADSSDQEKVVVCSVITSGRAEGEESLNNTQKYVPLRQKHQQLATKQQPMSTISSGPNTEFNTAIKTQVPSMQQRIQEQQPQTSIDTSQRKILVPSLDFDRLNISEIQKQQKDDKKFNAPKIHQDYHEEHRNTTEGGLSSSRSIFDRHSFQDFAQKIHNGEGFDINNQEFLKIKEQVMQFQAKEEEKKLKKQFKNKLVSPRTYERKRQDIELQLIKNKEEIKKQKQSLKEQYKQVAEIIQETMISYGTTKQELKSAYNHQHSHNVVSGAKQSDVQDPGLLSSRRGQLSKRDGGILEQIETYREDDNKQEEIKKEQEKLKHKQMEMIQQQALIKQQEEERIKLEKEKQAKLEEQRKKDLQAKKEEDLRLKKQQELEKQKQEKEAQELKQKQEQQKEQERIRKEELKKREEEEVRVKKQQEEANRQKELELKKKRDQEEEALRQQQLKLEQEQKLKQQQDLQRQLEQEQLKKRLEKEEKERQQELKRQKDLEYRNKLEAMERKFEEQKRAQAVAQQQQQEKYLIQPDTFSLSSEPGINSGHKQQEEDEYSEQFDFDEANENKLLNDIIKQKAPARVKEVIDSIEDSNTNSQQTEQEQPVKEEEPRLSRTRSSQYLKAVGQVSDEQIDMSPDESDKGFNDERIEQIPNLNEISMEDDQKHNQGISEAISSVNFFTQNFDDEKPQDLMGKISNTTELSMAPTSDIYNPSTSLIESFTQPQNKIYVEDKGEEILIDPYPNRFAIDHKQSRLSQEMRNQIPVEEEEKFNPGMPVSPVSLDGIRIQTGSQSLESTLSDGADIKTAIQEAKAEQQQPIDINAQTDKLTDEIFKVMMEEMKLELDILFINDQRKGDQQQNYMLNESGRFLIFERRGIKTDLFAIEKYVEEVLDEVIKDRQRYMLSIQTPLSKNSSEILNQLQNSEIGSYEHFETNYPPVLALELYLRLEKRRKENREKANQERQESQGPVPPEGNLIAECEHIHNKVLFDCINDSLLQFKPYGKDGAPLPWSRQNRRLRPMEEFTLEEMFELVKHDLFRWAIMQAGTMPRKEFVFGGVFDDELFSEIREKKLATLLAREMIETEPKWLSYEFEEAQVKIDIGDMILEQLVTETIAIMNQIQAQN